MSWVSLSSLDQCFENLQTFEQNFYERFKIQKKEEETQSFKFKNWFNLSVLFLSQLELQKHKYPSILDTKEHLQNWGTFMEDTYCFYPHFNYINWQEIFSIKLISLILQILSCSSNSLSSLRLLYCCFLEDILIEAALQLLTWEFPQWGCLAAAYLRIYSLRLPCDCLLVNFLIGAALGLVAWKFPHQGYLFIDTSFLRILNWDYMIEEASLMLSYKTVLF